jgi:hypothetical protein
MTLARDLLFVFGSVLFVAWIAAGGASNQPSPLKHKTADLQTRDASLPTTNNAQHTKPTPKQRRKPTLNR